MNQKSSNQKQQDLESVLRDFGIKPSEDKRDSIRLELEKQREQFKVIDRIHSQKPDRDISR